jgi:hypothetical protein
MLIFDQFPSEAKARAFMKSVEKQFKRKTYFCHQEGPHVIAENAETQIPFAPINIPRGTVDHFPFELTAPIVCVEREENPVPPKDADGRATLGWLNDPTYRAAISSQAQREAAIEENVEKFGGVFAGT